MTSSSNRSAVPFVLAGLVVSLFISVIVSNFAAESPDALQRAVIDSSCQGAATAEEAEECLAEQEGDPVLQVQPEPLFDYEATWLSGLVGVIACFALGAGIVLLLRRTGGASSGASGRVR